MLNYFKAYLDNVVEPVCAGVALGAVCGGVAGVVGLYQMCSGNDGAMSLDLCSSMEPQIIPSSQKAAAVTGAVAGSFVGFLAGAVAYPIYAGFSNWCRREIQRNNLLRSEQEGNELNVVRVQPL